MIRISDVIRRRLALRGGGERSVLRITNRLFECRFTVPFRLNGKASVLAFVEAQYYHNRINS